MVSLSFWNISAPLPNDTNYFDYYDQPSFPAVKMTTLSTYMQRVIVRENASIEVCGMGWNCSYTISFNGPGYKCGAYNDGSDGGPVTQPSGTVGNPPFNSSILLPGGNFSYYALTKLGEYAAPQINGGAGGVPLDGVIPPRLGHFRTEPVLWIGYSTLQDGATLPTNRSDPKWNSVLKPHLMFCEHYETRYDVRLNYTAGSQIITVMNRTFLRPLVDTVYQPGMNASDGTRDATVAIPETNYILPTQIEKYRLTAAYHSLGHILRDFLNGTISMFDPTIVLTTTTATTTKLIDNRSYLTMTDMLNGVQGMYEDIIFSLFSNPQFLVVSWASKPSQSSGFGPSNDTIDDYPCTKTRTLNVFIYHARDLWLVYGFFILIAGLNVVFGTLALYRNSWNLKNTHFSSIVEATRTTDLNQVSWRTDKSGETQEQTSRTKLLYRVGGENPYTAVSSSSPGRGSGPGPGFHVYSA